MGPFEHLAGILNHHHIQHMLAENCTVRRMHVDVYCQLLHTRVAQRNRVRAPQTGLCHPKTAFHFGGVARQYRCCFNAPRNRPKQLSTPFRGLFEVSDSVAFIGVWVHNIGNY